MWPPFLLLTFKRFPSYIKMLANSRSQASLSMADNAPSLLRIRVFGIVARRHLTRQGCGRCADDKSVRTTSLGHDVALAVVIMATTVESLVSLNFLPERTTAGRLFKTGMSEKGKGMTMVSYLSQITKCFLVLRAVPFDK